MWKWTFDFFFKDPNKWKEHNSLCAGPHQSPINIDTKKGKTKKFPPFVFTNYDKSLPENLENNGHTGMQSMPLQNWFFFYLLNF